ncbi:MAG: outer membrane beta-barrel protein [Cyclobacteriaceae bacterium]
MNYARKAFKTTHDDTNEGTQRVFIEKQDWLDIPLFIKYSVDSGRVRPFFFAGIAANLLLGAKLSPLETDFNSPSQGTQQVSQSPDISISDSRYFFNRSLVFGGGIKYKVGKNFFTFGLSYMAGLNNLTSKVYNYKLATGFEYSSDYFRLDNLAFSVGYIKPLYEPRKKKQAVVGLLRKLGLKKR